MRLSEPQKRLMRRLRDEPVGRPALVTGNELRTARSLERVDLVEVVEMFGGNVYGRRKPWHGFGARLTYDGYLADDGSPA